MDGTPSGAWEPLVAAATVGLLLGLGVAAAWARRQHRSAATLANLLSALRAGDYSVRLALRGPSLLADATTEFNRLADTLRGERLKAMESAALLDDVLAGVDIAILAFDTSHRIRLANAAAQRLAGSVDGEVVGRSLREVGLGVLADAGDGTLRAAFPGGEGSFQVRASHMRRDGEPLQVRLVSDIGKALRDKEEEAWRRLVRVMAHEINNSLAPIRSIADTVARGLDAAPLDAGTANEYADALRAVAARATGLNRFLQPYSRLARLPDPQPRPIALTALLGPVCAVLGISPRVDGAEGVVVDADPPLIEQVLVNLLRNAVEAGGPADAVAIRVDVEDDRVRVAVLDGGQGLPASDNLFVPFFTTKPEGSGIGLVLCRQIVEAHGGTLGLRNRDDAPGAEALFTLARVEAGLP